MIHTLTDSIYYSLPAAETDRPLLGYIAGSRCSLMVDSGTSPRHARDFLSALELLKPAPLGQPRS